MALPRALWRRAPLVLLRHRGVFAAVLAASFLVALSAAAAPLLRAGAESEALKTKLSELTPLGAGLTIESKPVPLDGEGRRRAVIDGLAARLPDVARPIHTVSTYAAAPSPGAFPLEIVPMARDGATAHVKRLAGDGNGAWLAQRDAKLLGIRPGGVLRLIAPSGRPPVRVRVGAIYLQLDQDVDNPYWVNFTHRIRSTAVDPPPLPSFLLVDRAELARIAREAGNGIVTDTFELPVEERALTPAKAKALDGRFRRIRRTTGTLGIGCPCQVTSPLSSSVRLAALSVDALTPVIGLLAGFAAALALAAALVAGTFGVRRRAGEARLSAVQGEPRALFGVRSSLESLVPGAIGAAAGLAAALLLAGRFTPGGTVDAGVVRRAVWFAVLAYLAAVAAVGLGAAIARGPLLARQHPRRLPLPWEALPLAGAAVLFVVIERGSGLSSNAAVGAHPRLVVLALPLLVTAALAGVVVRLARRPLRHARPRALAAFLAVRRLVAARALLVVLVVTAAVAFAAVSFAEILDRTLESSTQEKAYVANGADVQGVVDPYQRLPQPLPFPAARVVQDFDSARVVGSPRSLELMSVRPAELIPVVRWSWGGDPRGLLRRLAASDAPLPAIANGSARNARAITFDGRSIPVEVVGVARSFPGMIEGEDVLVVSAAKLERVVRRPYESATAYVWVRGPTLPVIRALERASPSPDYITTTRQFLQSADLSTASRTYGYVRVVALGAALVALVALLLYLQARARTQLVTTELLRRMGMPAASRTAAVALEAAVLCAFASALGLAGALVAARPLVTRLDPIPQYAPSPALDVPWSLLALSYVALVVLAGLAGALASFARGDLAKAVRVA